MLSTSKSVSVGGSFNTIRKPWKHQVEALERAGAVDDFVLFFETGTGKTLTAIMVSRYYMFKAGGALKVLVLSPAITLENWKREWLEASNFKAEQVRVLHGPGSKRAEVLAKGGFLVGITNYESLTMKPVLAALKKWAPDIVIFDESHRLKNHASQRSKAAFDLAKGVRKRLLLTGTPILNSPMDIFGQWKVLDLGETFGQNFYEFRGKYFYDKNARMPGHIHFPNFQIKEGALDDIKASIAPKSMFVAKSECLDLPPMVRTIVNVDLSSEQRRLYLAMAKDLIAFVDSGVSVARLALTKTLRLQEITSGFLTVEKDNGDNEKHAIKDNPRLKALEEIMSDRAEGSKIIVWACFRQNYGAIAAVCRKLHLPYVEIHGEKSAKEKNAAIEAFNSDDKIRVCIGAPAAAGIGINLISSNVSIFYSRSFSLEHDIQAEARNYRGGSEIHDKVTRIDLIANDTIDEFIATKLDAKQQLSDSVVHDLVKILKGKK